jgi:hypothetical protein
MRILHSVRSLLFVLVLTISASAFAQIGVSITIGPPALPVYEQPICPGDGYIWTPGYWAYDYDAADYYWVPGTWVLAPEVGFLWTPGYWGWGGAAFIFHEGYWGPHVGFYGGIVYGFGYFGVGFEGGRWDNGQFFYNRSVTNVNVTNIHNVYNTTVINNNTTVNRVSYNGGNGGVATRPTAEEESAANERHIPAVTAQTQHEQQARSDPQQRASVNHGKPAIAATPKPGAFHESGVVQAKEAGAPYTPPAKSSEASKRGNEAAQRPENNAPENNASHNNVPRPENAVHPNDLPPAEKSSAPNTGNAKLDKQYQQQQAKLAAQQDQERQKLQKQQDQEHQKMAKQNADDAKKQQMEQQHQQQTQQLAQRHAQQQQQLQARQQPANHEPAPAKEK